MTEAARPPAARKCPICGRPAVEAMKPFCSKRCADIDLNRWFTGAYAIPVVEPEDTDDEEPRPARRADAEE